MQYNTIVKLNDKLIKPGRFELGTNSVHRDRRIYIYEYNIHVDSQRHHTRISFVIPCEHFSLVSERLFNLGRSKRLKVFGLNLV